MKYHSYYKLLIDLPSGQKKGHILAKRVGSDYSLYWAFQGQDDDRGGVKSPIFTIDQMQQAEFFEPVGEPQDLVLPFPDKMKIGEYLYLVGETRLVPTVDQIRLIAPIFESDEFYNAVYELLKKMYNDKYFPSHE